MSLSSLSNVDTSTLHDRVYLQLRQALMAGRFQPGEAVTLRGVAEVLGTSIMPVREAVRRLMSERALEMPTSRSIRVPLISRSRFDQLCEARCLVEGAMAAQAAEKIDESEIDELEVLNGKMAARKRKGDLKTMLDLNQTFHYTIYVAAENPVLLSLAESLWLQSGPILNLIANAEPGDRVNIDLNRHDDLIKAFRKRDVESARRALQNDIREAAQRYRQHIRASSAVVNQRSRQATTA